MAYWGPRMAEVFLTAQSSAALGTALHLVADRQNVVRIAPILRKGFTLDSYKGIGALAGLGQAEARKALPVLRERFLDSRAESFTPHYQLAT